MVISMFSFSHNAFKICFLFVVKTNDRLIKDFFFFCLTLYQTTKFFDQFKFRAFADDKLKVLRMAKFVLDKKENIVGKEENAGYQHFLLFLQCFQKVLFSGSRLSGL